MIRRQDVMGKLIQLPGVKKNTKPELKSTLHLWIVGCLCLITLSSGLYIQNSKQSFRNPASFSNQEWVSAEQLKIINAQYLLSLEQNNVQFSRN